MIMNGNAKRYPLMRGFTLIELMITVAIVAILAAVAYPSYNEYVLRSHRSNARNGLVGASAWMERAATAQGAYPVTADVPSGFASVEGRRYTVTWVSTPQAYTFTATPFGAQAVDKCGTLITDQAGRRTVSGASLSADECWSR